MTIRKLVFGNAVCIAALALLTAAPLAAQHHPHGQQAAHGHDMSAMHCGTGMILHHKTELSITAAQAERIEALQQAAAPACTRHAELAKAAHQRAVEALDADSPDFVAFEAKLKEAAGHMVEGHVAVAKADVQARAVLTPAQREELKTLMQRMHKR